MQAVAVQHALADAMEHGMEKIPKKQAHQLRRQMGDLLKPVDPQQQQQIRKTPVIRAIKELMIRIERFGERTQ
jgi:hypothetical protein